MLHTIHSIMRSEIKLIGRNKISFSSMESDRQNKFVCWRIIIGKYTFSAGMLFCTNKMGENIEPNKHSQFRTNSYELD